MKETLCKLDTIGLVGMQGSDFWESLLTVSLLKFVCQFFLRMLHTTYMLLDHLKNSSY
ncbi:hypothetical protein BLGI_3694 [Brevibacillus laterosporus GI-9]|nr:hypothetical protein BLGI_3694 [Brevibacillus laterosporus GI-9]